MVELLDVQYTGTHPRQRLDARIPDGKVDAIYIDFHGGGIERGNKWKGPEYINDMIDKKWLAKIGMSNAEIKGYFHDAGQPTTHFRVLKERGLDHRRIIVDESAPLYYIGFEESYPRMRFIVSDNDMPARYDQIMLVRSTLKYFGHENHDYVLKNGKHTAYCGRVLENGKSEYAQMILDFIKERS